MKIQIQFNIKTESDLEEFLDYINSIDCIQSWVAKKFPKRYKKIIEDYI